MAQPDARVDRHLRAFTAEVEAALGTQLVCLALHGSAAGADWVPRRSDVNTAVVVARVTLAVLEALAPVVARWRPRGFATPVLMDEEYLAGARDVFPMELDDIRTQHRVLAGRDVFSALTLDRTAIRHECERETRGKLLRLRALFLEAADRPPALEELMVESLKSFLVVLRHLVRLRGACGDGGYPAVLAAGEAAIGPLPVMRRLLGHRSGVTPLDRPTLRSVFGAYLAEVERIAAAVDALDA
jgi:hypothetical protein